MQLTRQKIFFFGLPLLAMATIFLIPDRAYAGISDFFTGMEPACKVLKTNTDAHAIWKTLLTFVNSLVVALLIVVSFVEILHVNINTYGVKKILPTLILAVIAANFSYIAVRLLVDLANIVVTAFSQNNKINNLMTSSRVFTFPPFNWSNWFSDLIINLVIFATAVMMYILAFLFVVRNWVIYILAIVSPVAFMAMVLPQTKSLFNQWWQNIFRWVFMPVVSIGLLWLASQMTPLIEKSPVMGAAIVGTILYFAITMPFKLGGAIMSNFVKFSGAKTAGKLAKWGGNKVQKKFIDPLIDDAKRRVGNWYLKKATTTPQIEDKYAKKIRAAELRGAGADEINKLKEQRAEEIKRAATFLGNPFGTIARRSIRKNLERETRKEEEKGLLGQGVREALGGKTGEYLNEKRLKGYGHWLEDINTLGGEDAWAKDNARRKYFEQQIADNKVRYKPEAEKAQKELKQKWADFRVTQKVARGAKATKEELREAYDNFKKSIKKTEQRAKLYGEGFSDSALNSAQYEMRIKAKDTALANIKNVAIGMAYKADPNFLANGQWAGVYEDLSKVMTPSKALEKTAMKATGDFDREAIAVVTKLNEEIEGFRRAVKTLDAVNKQLATADKNGASDDVKEALRKQIALATDNKIKSERGYKEQITAMKEIPRYFDKSTGKLTGIAKASLSGMILDTNGNMISDVNKAKSMTDVNGIPESISWLFRDRTAKALSEVVKNEEASEFEKRTGVESARLLRDELAKEYKLFSSGRGNELGAEVFWKVKAAAKNALSVNPRSAEGAETQNILNDIDAESALTDIHVRNNMARKNESAVGLLVNNHRSFKPAIAEARKAYVDANSGDFIDMNDAQIDSALSANNDFQKELAEAVIKAVAQNTPIRTDQLQKFAKIAYGANGKVQFNMRSIETIQDPKYAENVAFMQEIQRVKIASSERDIGEMLKKGSDMVASTQSTAAAINFEAGKGLDKDHGLDGQFFRLPEEIREANKQYEIGFLGYSEAEMKGFLGEDRYNEIMAKYKPE